MKRNSYAQINKVNTHCSILMKLMIFFSLEYAAVPLLIDEANVRRNSDACPCIVAAA